MRAGGFDDVQISRAQNIVRTPRVGSMDGRRWTAATESRRD